MKMSITSNQVDYLYDVGKVKLDAAKGLATRHFTPSYDNETLMVYGTNYKGTRRLLAVKNTEGWKHIN